MAHGHEAAHRHHARAPFDWHHPGKAIVSALEAPFEPPNPSPPPNPDGGPRTITSVVYKTLKPTFNGPIGGYITPTADASHPTATPNDDNSTTKETSTKDKKPATPKATDSSDSLSKSITSPTSPSDSSQSIVLASQTTSGPGATSSSSSDRLSQDGTTSTTTGMTTGSKAGIAIGVICGIGAVLLLIFFLARRHRKSSERERLDDEKSSANWDSGTFDVASAGAGATRAASTRTARTASTAPRLSLRPVTQFSPTFGDGRTSRANALQVASAKGPTSAARNISPQGQSAWERPTTSNNQTRENPFGNHAEAVDPVNAAGPAAVDLGTASGDVVPSSAMAVAPGATAGAVVGGAAVGLIRGASKRGNEPKPLDFTKNRPNVFGPAVASPTGTDYSMSEAPSTPVQTTGSAAIAAAGGPQNSAVHRVQLDFKPSMDDELELRAGQLIRLLHEYDDGWALCIRLDRSQQGVAPRTCLSTRPVKPRPNPGPNGLPRGNPPPGMRVPGYAQQGRPMSPANHRGPRSQSPAVRPQGRPMSPANNMGPRSQSPAGRPQGRPMSPANNMGQRSQSPAGQGRAMTPTGRSMTPTGRNSPAGQQRQERRITPPGPSRMNSSPPTMTPEGQPSQSPTTSPKNSISQAPVGRKPVPGQAM